MSGAIRVAVDVGSETVRVALAADGPARVVAQWPAARFAGVSLAGLLADVVGSVPDELVLVVPSSMRPAAVAAVVADASPAAAVVRAVSAASAAAAGTGAVAVLDVGATTAEATWLPDGSCATAAAGGAELDRALGASSAVRERLSLLPEVDDITAEQAVAALTPVLARAVAALDRVRRGRLGPVLLVGGVARCPLLAQLVDASGVSDAVVAAGPETAAVLGALADVLPTASARPRVAVLRLPPLPARNRTLRAAVATVAAGAAVVALLAAGAAGPGSPPAPAAGELVQYGYRMALPEGWAHTGGLPARRRVLMTPTGAPRGSDLLLVEASPVGYDVAAEAGRFGTDLRDAVAAGAGTGRDLGAVDTGASLAGRPVATYAEHLRAGVEIEWYVVGEGRTQLSVGCQHTAAGAAQVAAACALIVATLHPA